MRSVWGTSVYSRWRTALATLGLYGRAREQRPPAQRNEAQGAMKQLSHVVWNEGMHLAQHHFQAQSRFFEDTVHSRCRSLFFRPYGLVACELDRRSATKRYSRARARARRHARRPAVRHSGERRRARRRSPIRDLFSPTSDSHLVLLADSRLSRRAVERRRRTARSTRRRSRRVRYTGESATVRDDMTGRDERPRHGRPQELPSLLDTDARGRRADGLVTLPIARVAARRRRPLRLRRRLHRAVAPDRREPAARCHCCIG